MKLKLSFLAPSTYGKSTAVSILMKNYDANNIRIAEPLYQLQEIFYTFLGMTIEEKQDGELLQFYGLKIRKESPMFLLDEFIKRLNNQTSSIILNDDCRPYDYETLKSLGFIFIRINGMPRNRDDHRAANAREIVEWQSDIPCDYEVDNIGTLEEYEENLNTLVERIRNEMLYCSSSKNLHM